jgi:hypothetical protein
MPSSEGTVTFKCEGCGVRKPEAERYRPRSAFTVCSPACLDTAAQKKAPHSIAFRGNVLNPSRWS